MFDVNISMDDIKILSIQKEDIECVRNFLSFRNFINGNSKNEVNIDELYQRFLEYYISENEFFLKIISNNKLIGIIKGRIEFKNEGELWVGYFYVDSNALDKKENSMGNRIMSAIIKFFIEEYGINNFYTTISDDDKQSLKLWQEIGYKILREAQNYYEINGISKDMLILKKVNAFSADFHNSKR